MLPALKTGNVTHLTVLIYPASGPKFEVCLVWGQWNVRNYLPGADTGVKSQQMNAPQKQSSLSSATSENKPAKAQPDQECPATLGQKIFIVGLCLYVVSLIWLTLSHNWYGVLPKWLDPH